MTRRPVRIVVAAAVALALGMVAPGPRAGAQTPSFALLTPEEQMQYENVGSGAVRSIAIQSNAGPQIQIAAPQGFTLRSPVDFDIRVSPRDGVAVDMSTLRIDYRLGPAWVNVTNRIMRHAAIAGARLRARGAELPQGDHALRVSIRDAQQRVTQATVRFTVAN